MSKLENRRIQVAWRRETLKVENAVVIKEVGIRLKFEDNAIQMDGERIEQEWKPTWKRVKRALQKSYQSKDQQNRFFREQEKEFHLWLTHNLHPQKTSTIMSMLKQMMETKSWKRARELTEDGRSRVCHGHDETVEQLVAGCIALSNSEYLTRHNRALMILTVIWAKEHNLAGADRVWYNKRWK